MTNAPREEGSLDAKHTDPNIAAFSETARPVLHGKCRVGKNLRACMHVWMCVCESVCRNEYGCVGRGFTCFDHCYSCETPDELTSYTPAAK